MSISKFITFICLINPIATNLCYNQQNDSKALKSQKIIKKNEDEKMKKKQIKNKKIYFSSNFQINNQIMNKSYIFYIFHDEISILIQTTHQN